MAFTVGDIIETRLFCTQTDQTSVNVRQWVVTAQVAGGPSENFVADALSNIFANLYKALMSVGARYNGLGLRRINPLPIAVESFSPIGAGAGAVAGTNLPRQTCGIISLRTPFGGRKYKGRIYVPFPSATDNTTNGVPTTTYGSNLALLGSQFIKDQTVISGASSVALTPIVFHRSDRTYTQIVGAVYPLRWATQRRRGSYGRPNTSPV